MYHNYSNKIIESNSLPTISIVKSQQ